MQYINRGFTLVELIVVITILAILWTISFISFTSYNQSARNSIRLDGISKVATILENQKITWKNLLWFSNGGQEIPNASVAGALLTVNTDYVAGEINPTAVSVQLRQFSDPVTGDSYRLWVTGKKSTQYEVATTIQEGSLEVAKVVGTYKARLSTLFPGAGDAGSRSITLSDVSSIRQILVGDIVWGPGIASGSEVTSISGDGLTINIDTVLTWTVTGIGIALVETPGLILWEGTTNTPVTNNNNIVPYRLN